MNVEQIIANMPAIANPHNVIVRQAGDHSDRIHIFLECTISPNTPLPDAHDLSTEIERELISRLEGIADVFVHLEPPDQ
jgi:divalent metal cation (Fe/Co/Zn/Cd) transporter